MLQTIISLNIDANQCFRCDGRIDCDDGSDEDINFCDQDLIKDDFICCTANKRISKDRACDDVIDCFRDMSDEFLQACINKTEKGELVCLPPEKSKQPVSPIPLRNVTTTFDKCSCKKLHSLVAIHSYVREATMFSNLAT